MGAEFYCHTSDKSIFSNKVDQIVGRHLTPFDGYLAMALSLAMTASHCYDFGYLALY